MDKQDTSSDKEPWETPEYRETLAALKEALVDLELGDTLPIEEAFAEIKQKHGLPNQGSPSSQP